jgi:hypothetical protein
VQALEGRDEALSEQIKTVVERPAAPGVSEELDAHPLLPKVTFRGFGDLGYYTAFRRTTASDIETGAYIGAQDLFLMAQLTDRMSFLLESDFHYHDVQPFNVFEHLHLERAILAYQFSDLLGIKVGKTHTPLGYWNQTFHHGTWLQTTIFRPEIYEFEAPFAGANKDHGGYLPVHSVGAELFGRHMLEPGEVKYSLGVYNGRGEILAFTANNQDRNDFKAVNLLLGFRPQAIEGLETGFDAYVDRIPNVLAEDLSPAPAVFGVGRTEPIDELILGWYGAYVHRGTELLGEVFRIHHDVKETNTSIDSWGGYVQGGYKISKRLTPYYRFDFLDADSGPFFFGHELEFTMHTVGLRWDAANWNAVKLEYSVRANQHGTQVQEDDHQMTVNTSYTF